MLAGYPIKQAASGVFGHDEKQESTFVTGVEPLQKREMSNLSTQKYCSWLWCFLLLREESATSELKEIQELNRAPTI